MQNNTLSQTIAGAAILVVVVAAVVALAWHSTLTGAEAFSVLSTIITLGGGALAVHSGAKVGARAAGAISDQTSEGSETTTKTTTN